MAAWPLENVACICGAAQSPPATLAGTFLLHRVCVSLPGPLCSHCALSSLCKVGSVVLFRARLILAVPPHSLRATASAGQLIKAHGSAVA